MFGRKTGALAAVLMALALFSGCTTDGKVDERQARNWYEEMRGNGSVTNDTSPDGNGLFSGGPNWSDSTVNDKAGNNTERNTYGMRTDGTTGANGGTTLGQDIRNAWDNVKNDVNNMGNNNNGNKTTNNR